MQVLKTDNDQDYFNPTLRSFLSSHGDCHTHSCVDTPNGNGIVGRKNRHLKVACSQCLRMFLIFFRGESILTATFLIN